MTPRMINVSMGAIGIPSFAITGKIAKITNVMRVRIV